MSDNIVINHNGRFLIIYGWMIDAEELEDLDLTRIAALSLIYSLSIKGECRCVCSMKYIAGWIRKTERSAINVINDLERGGFINIARKKYQRNEYALTEKVLKYEPNRMKNFHAEERPCEKISHVPGEKISCVPGEKFSCVPGEKFSLNNIEDNTEVNNIDNNIALSRREKKRTPESVAEVESYFKEKGYAIDCHAEAEAFFNFYESKGWRVGKNPMTKWKAAASGWAGRQLNKRSSYKKKSSYVAMSDENPNRYAGGW